MSCRCGTTGSQTSGRRKPDEKTDHGTLCSAAYDPCADAWRGCGRSGTQRYPRVLHHRRGHRPCAGPAEHERRTASGLHHQGDDPGPCLRKGAGQLGWREAHREPRGCPFAGRHRFQPHRPAGGRRGAADRCTVCHPDGQCQRRRQPAGGVFRRRDHRRRRGKDECAGRRAGSCAHPLCKPSRHQRRGPLHQLLRHGADPALGTGAAGV